MWLAGINVIKNLTDLAIQKLKYNGSQTVYFDATLKGFGVRVGKRTKRFIVAVGKDRKIISLGTYPEDKLKDERVKAKRLLLQYTGKHKIDLDDAREDFLDSCKGRLKLATVQQYKSYLDYVDLPLRDLSKQSIMQQLKQWSDKPTAQNYAYASIRAYLNWCMDEGYIETHPLVRGKPPNRLETRSRVLSDEEMGHIWRCTEDNTYGYILRLLILTGQRRAEVWKLKPEDIKDDTITFHTKGTSINVLPITPLVKQNLVGIPFKFNNWSGAKHRFDTDCLIQDWRLHDLRRTLATKLASMGVSVITVERILGHSFGGVKAIYNRYSYLSEMKEALLMYEDHIKSLATINA
jgi:integrase